MPYFALRLQLMLLYFFIVFEVAVSRKHNYPWCFLGPHGTAVGRVTLFTITILFFLSLFIVNKRLIKFLNQHKLRYFKILFTLSIFLVYAFYLALHKFYLNLGYHFPFLWLVSSILVMISLIIIICTWQKSFTLERLFCVVIGYFLLSYSISIVYFPFDPRRADMLSAIIHGLSAFFTGESPYVSSSIFIMGHQITVGTPPYFPFTLISYLPAYLLHLNIMVMNLVYYAATLLIIKVNFKRLSIFGQMLCCLFFVNPYLLNHAEIYLSFFMLEICILRFYLHRLPQWLCGLLFGILATTLQFAWVILPFWILRTSSNFRDIIIKIVLIAIVFALASYYFSNGFINDYYHAIFIHNHDYMSSFTYDFTFGVGQIFYFLANQKLLYLLQVILLIGLFGYAIKSWYQQRPAISSYRVIERVDYTILAALAYFIFLSFNYFIENYLYLPALLFISIL